VPCGGVGTGHPCRAVHDARVDEVAHPPRLAEGAGTDVALHQLRVCCEVGLVEGRHLGWSHLRLKPSHVELAIALHADRQRLPGSIGVDEHDEHVLQRVGGRPRTAIAPCQIGPAVEAGDQRPDRRRVRGVLDVRGRGVVGRRRSTWRAAHRLDVGGIPAARAPGERVFARIERRKELLACRPAHGAGRLANDHVGQAEPSEGPDVRRPMSVIGRLEPAVVDIEGVRVLHHEITATQETRARSGFVAVLGLYLKDRQRQLLVRRADVLHQQREHLLVRRTQQVVGAPTVLQTEQVVAVLAPTAGRLVRPSRQQRREVDLLEAGPLHLLPPSGRRRRR
jgi:hypothetical protein